MELLAGLSLADWLARGRQASLPQILRIGRDVARGLAAAHARGLVHRDIKPANLWLEKARTPRNGRSTSSAGFRVKILDFGLARPMDGSSDLTHHGMIVGSVSFVAPEQARGRPVDGRADLFSLGCVLYRLGTGRRPFPGKGLYESVVSLATTTPPTVRELNPALPPAFSDLVMRLLAHDPAQRPATAEQVEEELRAIGRTFRLSSWRPDEATLPLPRAACPQRWKRWGLLTGVLAVALLGGTAAVLLAGRPRVSGPGNVQVPVALPRTVRLIPRCAHLAHGNEIRCLAYSPDGRYLATGSFDETVALWDVSTMQVVARLGGARGVVEAVAFSADSATVAATSSSGRLCWWHVPDGKPLGERLAHPGGASALAFAPAGTTGWMLATGGADRLVCLWPHETESRSIRLAGHTSRVDTLAVSGDGTRLASGSCDRTIRIWDVKSRAELAALRGCTDRVSHVVFSPDGRLLASADADEQCVRVWDVERRVEALRLRVRGNVHGVDFSPDGRWVATASQRGDGVALWDTATGRRVDVAPGETNYPWAVAFSADGKQIAAGDQAVLKVWRVRE
jgi:hypothetical protein